MKVSTIKTIETSQLKNNFFVQIKPISTYRPSNTISQHYLSWSQIAKSLNTKTIIPKKKFKSHKCRPADGRPDGFRVPKILRTWNSENANVWKMAGPDQREMWKKPGGDTIFSWRHLPGQTAQWRAILFRCDFFFNGNVCRSQSGNVNNPAVAGCFFDIFFFVFGAFGGGSANRRRRLSRTASPKCEGDKLIWCVFPNFRKSVLDL